MAERIEYINPREGLSRVPGTVFSHVNHCYHRPGVVVLSSDLFQTYCKGSLQLWCSSVGSWDFEAWLFPIMLDCSFRLPLHYVAMIRLSPLNSPESRIMSSFVSY